MEFICKDGVQVKACRMVLAGRCPVIDSMLTNGMLESDTSIVNFPEIPAPALLAVLEYLYTSNIGEYLPKDWQMGLETISAAHFFLLPTMEKIVEELIMAHVPGVGGDLQKAATMLTAAMNFKCLSHDGNTAILLLVNLLESNWMRSEYACDLSEEAVDFILRQTKPGSKSKDHPELSLKEYFRFRGVLVWCMYNAHSASIEEVDKLVKGVMPSAREDLYCKGVKNLSSMEVMWLPKYGGNCAPDEILQFLQSHGALQSVIRLLAHIDWVHIPPTILVKIVEPMKFIPESSLLDIFRSHSLHRVTPGKVKWAHHESFTVLSGGLVMRKNNKSPGSAVCRLPNRASDAFCRWRFTVKDTDSTYCELGFVCSEGPENPYRAWNFEEDCSNASGESSTTVIGVTLWHAGRLYLAGKCIDFEGSNPDNVIFLHTVEFQYHRSSKTCSVTVNGKKYGICWTDLPTIDIFPIVSLGTHKGASVKLDIISGFEIF